MIPALLALVALGVLFIGIGIGVSLWRMDSEVCAHERPQTSISTRWVEVNEKKNRPSLLLLEATSVCSECGKTIKHWYTEEQCQKYGIKTPLRISSSTS